MILKEGIPSFQAHLSAFLGFCDNLETAERMGGRLYGDSRSGNRQ